MSFHGFEKKEKLVREKIAEIAHEKFIRFGIRRVTMDEIARDMRISKKTLYLYFDGKEALVQATTERIAENMIPVVMQAMSEERPAAERLFRVFEAFSRLPRYVSTEFVRDIEADYPHIWAQVDERRRQVFGLFAAMIEQGIAEGAIRPEVHPKVVKRLLQAIIDQVFVPEVLGLGEFTTDAAVRTMITIFKGGMLNPEGIPGKEEGGAE